MHPLNVVLENFGLGRDVDTFDLTADSQAFSEMVRVLKPGGRLIFSTLVTHGVPTIAFNAHRIYGLEIIGTFYKNLGFKEEKLYISQENRFGPYAEVATESGEWGIYSWVLGKTMRRIPVWGDSGGCLK